MKKDTGINNLHKSRRLAIQVNHALEHELNMYLPAYIGKEEIIADALDLNGFQRPWDLLIWHII